MVWTIAAVSGEFLIGVGLLAVLVGVPLFVLAIIALVTGYIQYDAERYLEELEAAEGIEATDDIETDSGIEAPDSIEADGGELAEDHR